MDPKQLCFVLPPEEEPARRALLCSMEALASCRSELRVEARELLDLPSFGRMNEGPALVISERPLALPAGALGLCLVPSWVVHPLWARAKAHLYAVAHQDLVAPLARLGIPRSRIEVTGIPVTLFSRGRTRTEARTSLDLPTEAELVLAALVEGLEPHTLAQVVFQCTLLEGKATVVFFAGGDHGLQALLRREVPVHGLDALLLSDPAHLPDLLSAADLALTSSAGVPSSEALAADLSTLVIPSAEDAGEEAARFLDAHGAARLVPEVRTLAADLDLLRQDHAARSRLRQQANALLHAEPMASFLAWIQKAIEQREELLAPRDPGADRSSVAAPSMAEPKAAPRPLERLGGCRPTADAGSHAGSGGPRVWEESWEARDRLSPFWDLHSLTELIASEKAARARFETATAELACWRRRIGLAVEAEDPELRVLAEQELRHREAQVARLSAELERLAQRRLQARRVQPFDRDGSEERFRQLELDAELRALKRRLED